MQGMISPGLALSLALAGCGGSDYMAPMPRRDAGPFHDGGSSISDTPLYAAPIPDSGRPELGVHDSMIIDVAPGLDLNIDRPAIDVAPGLDLDIDRPAIDVAPGLDLDIDRPTIDASNEAARLDSDESKRG
jgi:hypothetical protein